jgi:hypothetical protein
MANVQVLLRKDRRTDIVPYPLRDGGQKIVFLDVTLKSESNVILKVTNGKVMHDLL